PAGLGDECIEPAIVEMTEVHRWGVAVAGVRTLADWTDGELVTIMHVGPAPLKLEEHVENGGGGGDQVPIRLHLRPGAPVAKAAGVEVCHDLVSVRRADRAAGDGLPRTRRMPSHGPPPPAPPSPGRSSGTRARSE